MSSIQFTSERPRENTWLVYFNGIEVPTVNVDVRMGVWAIPSAVISMPPDRELQRLGAEDRVQVTAFYLDNYHTEIQQKSPDFRLLFEGDIHGWQYTNTPAGRMLSFKAVNYMDILDSLYTYFMTGVDNFAAGQLLENKDPNLNTLGFFGPLFPAALLYVGLDPKSSKIVRRPYDLLENAINACISDTAQEKLASVAAVNFYARYMRRTMFLDRLAPSPLLEIDHMRITDDADVEGVFPLLRYVRYQDTLKTIRGRMDSIADASIWNILRDIYTRMYYEISAITTAPIAQVNYVGNGVPGEIIGPASKTPTGKQPNRILNYVTKPEWKFGVPPSCNVIFPSMITQFAYEENYAAQATRLHLNDDWLPNLISDGGKATEFCITSVSYPVRAQEELLKREPLVGDGNAMVSGKNFLIWPEEFYRGPNVIQESIPEWFVYMLKATMTQSGYEITEVPIEKDTKTAMWSAVPATDGDRVDGKPANAIDTQVANTIANAGTSEADRTEAARVKLTWMKRLYARAEYHRQRASCKSGIISTIFNPYIIPGFPVVIFDELEVGNHLIAYASTVSHALGQGKSSTTVSFTHAQTLDEYMNGIRESRLGENPEARTYQILANPPNPVPEIRAVEQMWDLADQYFRELLHQHLQYSNPLKTAAFDFTKAVSLVLPDNTVLDTAAALTDKGVLNGVPYLSAYSRIRPTDAFRAMFDSATAAMGFISRPVCTLEEYIDFYSQQSANGRGCRNTEISPNQERQGKGATYYEQILKFTRGPGDPVAVDKDGNVVTPVTADTRADWETRLLNYRKKIIFQLHPQEA